MFQPVGMSKNHSSAYAEELKNVLLSKGEKWCLGLLLPEVIKMR